MHKGETKVDGVLSMHLHLIPIYGGYSIERQLVSAAKKVSAPFVGPPQQSFVESLARDPEETSRNALIVV